MRKKEKFSILVERETGRKFKLNTVKTRSILLPVLMLIAAAQISHAQIDTSRRSEIRLSGIGNTHFTPNFDERLQDDPQFSDISLAYLRRIGSGKLLMKAELSGRLFPAYTMVSVGEIVGEGNLYSNTLFLGVERQTQFRHFGFFLGAGIQGSYVNYKGDINFPEEDPINNYEYKQRSIGIAGQTTMYTNISSNIYVYLTSSFNFLYVSGRGNEDYGDIELANYIGVDSQLIFLDAVGIAYKF